jgi:hypothetical protein
MHVCVTSSLCWLIVWHHCRMNHVLSLVVMNLVLPVELIWLVMHVCVCASLCWLIVLHHCRMIVLRSCLPSSKLIDMTVWLIGVMNYISSLCHVLIIGILHIIFQDATEKRD